MALPAFAAERPTCGGAAAAPPPPALLDWAQTEPTRMVVTATSLEVSTKSSAIAEGPRDATCQLKSYQLPRNSAEITYTTGPD